MGVKYYNDLEAAFYFDSVKIPSNWMVNKKYLHICLAVMAFTTFLRLFTYLKAAVGLAVCV